MTKTIKYPNGEIEFIDNQKFNKLIELNVEFEVIKR